jgi:hypothetical protein
LAWLCTSTLQAKGTEVRGSGLIKKMHVQKCDAFRHNSTQVEGEIGNRNTFVGFHPRAELRPRLTFKLEHVPPWLGMVLNKHDTSQGQHH